MRTAKRSFVLVVALAAFLAACAGGGTGGTAPQSNDDPPSPAETATTSPVETATTSPAGSPTPSPVATASATPDGTVVWQAGSATLGDWIAANTYQCGSPSQSAASFYFSLVRDGTKCGRDQAMPEGYVGEGSFPLSIGTTYSWTFEYVDGNGSGQSPGMGPDTEAQSFIWQIVGTGCDTGGLALGFDNAPNGTQQWVFTEPGPTPLWSGPYTPQETDSWMIVIYLKEVGGSIQLWRNGSEVYDYNDVSTATCATNWWNFGPYKWRWEIIGGGGSDMTEVQASINNMTLTARQ